MSKSITKAYLLEELSRFRPLTPDEADTLYNAQMDTVYRAHRRARAGREARS